MIRTMISDGQDGFFIGGAGGYSDHINSSGEKVSG